jgi:tRNA(Met) cytidine acetyltransferase
MLRFIEDRASKLKLHYLASCFAASADLVPFWLGAGYWPARLGVTRDKASGCHSLLVLKPLLDDDAWRLLQKRFYRTTEKLLAARFRLLEPELVVQLWSGCSEAVTLSEWDWQRITAFARGELLLEESVDAIDGLLRLAMHQLRLHSSASEQDSMAVQILVAAIWQWRDARELEALYGVNGKRSLRQFLQLHVQRIVDRIAADGRVTD